MCNGDSLIRLSANGNGETKCIIFVDSIKKARESLKNYVNIIVGGYPFISGYGAIVNVHRLDEIKNLDFVSAVSPHTTVHTCMCDVRKHLMPKNPFSNSDFGEGVGVAVIDTGLYPHIDFFMPKVRAGVFKDFVGNGTAFYDDNGHGTAVAGIIGGNGLLSGGKYKGIAPKVTIIPLKAIGANGDGGAFNILQAMQWIYDNRLKHNIGVVCMSFGASPLPKNDPLSIGAEMLWKSGITVVASAGNSGPESETIRSPGINPSIITVGALDYSDGEPKVAEFSSRGPSGGFQKPDIVTDGVSIISCSSESYNEMSGTSMSAPIVAGICAAMLSKNPNLTPDRIKELLLKNAIPLEGDGNSVGFGKLDIGFFDELDKLFEKNG